MLRSPRSPQAAAERAPLFALALLLAFPLLVLPSPALAKPLDASAAARRVERILLIGLDGAEWDLITALSAQGRLPHIDGLVKRGASGPLRSERPTRSPAIWATIATGKDRSVHGIYDFTTNTSRWPKNMRSGEKRPVTSNMRKTKAIWNLLDGPDRSVAIVGWLNTWPAEAVNGSIVTSYTAVGTKKQITMKGSLYRDVPHQTYPDDLYTTILPLIVEVGDVTREQLAPIVALPADDDPILEVERAPSDDLQKRSIGDLVRGLRWSFANNTSYAAVARRLLEDQRPNLTAVYFEGIDSVGHRFWLFRHDETYIRERLAASDFDPDIAPRLKALFSDVVDNYYAFTDRLVGSLLEAAGPDTLVIIVSDHGFQDMAEAATRTSATFSGMHKLDGVMIMSGPGIRPGAKIEGARVADITPTILHLLGLPVGRDMTGVAVTGPLTEQFAAGNPVRTIETYETLGVASDASEASPIAAPGIDVEVLENLRALGYTAETDEYTPKPKTSSQAND